MLALWPALAVAAAIATMRRRAETRELEERLARLEAGLRELRLGTVGTPAAPAPKGAPQPAQPEPPAPAPPRLSRLEPPPSGEARPAPSGDLEERIGARWATWVGVVVTVFGVGLFVRWTIQNDLVGPGARVILGLLAGASLLAGGLWLRGKNALPYLSQGLAGGGLALLYLSLFAAHAVYGFVGPAAAFSAMSAVTLAGILVAVATDRQATAILALLGGLLTPKLVFAERPDERVLLGYLIVLDLLVLGAARSRV